MNVHHARGGTRKYSDVPQLENAFGNTGGIDIYTLIDGSNIVLG